VGWGLTDKWQGEPFLGAWTGRLLTKEQPKDVDLEPGMLGAECLGQLPSNSSFSRKQEVSYGLRGRLGRSLSRSRTDEEQGVI
jgi:hypothetical protein